MEIPLIEERYGRSFLASIGIHCALVLVLVTAPYLLPRPSAIRIGGPGGGTDGDSYVVGIASESEGGVGMTKPSLIPQPPVLVAEEPAKEETKRDAIPLANTVEPKKARARNEKPAERTAKASVPPQANVIPASPQPGAGGTGGLSGGSGGGREGGNGVLIGPGSGGFGDSWYARAVEARISSNWIRPAQGTRVEIIYSFYIADNGTIFDIKQEKSSGSPALDLTAERAIRASNPLAEPPPDLRGRPIQFVAQFVYPPTP